MVTIALFTIGTNTYLLGSGPLRILLDTAQGYSSYPPVLKQILADQKVRLSTCLLTHWHHDHIGGVEQVLDVCSEQGNGSLPKIYKSTPGLDPDGLLARVKSNNKIDIHDIKDGDTFSTPASTSAETFSVRAVHSPGHTKDHMSFLITSSSDPSEIGCLFTGDNVLGHGTAVFEDLGTYLSSLEKMKSTIEPGKRAFPAHGDVIEDGEAKIQMYIDHRKLREDEAMNVLRYGSTKAPTPVSAAEGASEAPGQLGGKELIPGKEWGSMEMVKVIYANVPENLHQPAERGLLMVLEKLKGEGRVVNLENGKWRISERAIL